MQSLGAGLSHGRNLAAGCVVFLMTVAGLCAAPLPSKPQTYIEDRAGLIDPAAAGRLRGELEQFERDTSTQILVATFPALPQGEVMEDFTVRTAHAWGVGRKAEDNGAVLFVFRDDRKMRIEVGYGLEGAIPDSVAARILNNELRPRFRSGDFTGGITAAVHSLMAASKGEYKGTGRTLAEGTGSQRGTFFTLILFLVFSWLMYRFLRRWFTGSVYRSSGRRMILFPDISIPRGRGSWGGGSGGGFHGGGGGFSGGGGGFGGGGASGSW